MWKNLINLISSTNSGSSDTPLLQPVAEKTVYSAGGYTSSNNITGDPTDYSKYYKGWVYANLNALASSVSKMELKLYKVRIINGEQEYIEIESHEALDRLDRLNAFTSFTDAVYSTQTFKDMAGDCFWYIDDAKQNIYILEPNKVKVLFDYIGGGGVKITGYRYTTIVDGKERVETYAPEQVIPFKNPNPLNPVRGMGLIQMALEAIDTDIYAEDFNKRFFLNNATPDTVLRTDQKINPDNMRRLEADLKRRFGGTRNAHKTMILEGGLDIKALNSTQRDMEFIEQSKWVRDKMMSIFGNTKVSLGITEDVNRANAEASLYGWLKEVIKPKMQSFVDSLNEFYLPAITSDALIFGFEDPYPEDSAEDIAEATAGYGKWLTRNEAREMFDLAPVEGGDEFGSAPSPLTPDQEPASPTDGEAPPEEERAMPKAIKNVDFEKRFRQLGIHKKLEKQKALLVTTKQIAAEAVKEAQGLVEHEHVAPKKDVRYSEFFTNDEVVSYHRAKINKIESVEARFAQKLDDYLTRLEEKTMAVVALIEEKGIAKASNVPLFDVDDEISFGINLFTPLMEEATMIGGMAANALIGEKLNYKPSAEVRKAVRSSVKKFTKSMTITDIDALTDKIVTLTANGASVNDIRAEVATFFDGARQKQIDTVVRTEVLRVANLATTDAYKQSDAVVGKQWTTAGDSDVCEFCMQAEKDYQDVALDANFANKGDTIEDGQGNVMTLDYSHLEAPPLHVRCRCDILPVLADEFSKTLAGALKPKKAKKIAADPSTDEIEKLRQELANERKYAKELEELISE